MTEKRLTKMNEEELVDMTINFKLALAKMLADQRGLTNVVYEVRMKGEKKDA